MSKRFVQLGYAATIGAMVALAPLAASAEGQPPPTAQLQYLIDRAGVEDLLGRYAKAVDFGTSEEYAALFTEDAVLHMQGKDFVGRAAIQKMISPAIDEPPPGAPPRRHLRHILSNILIDLAPDGQSAKVYESWATISKVPDGGPIMGAIGHYSDEVVKVNGKWFFAKRVIDLDLAKSQTPSR